MEYTQDTTKGYERKVQKSKDEGSDGRKSDSLSMYPYVAKSFTAPVTFSPGKGQGEGGRKELGV